MEWLGTISEGGTPYLQDQQGSLLRECEDCAYFLVGMGPVLPKFKIRLSVLKQHPSTLVALLAGADAVRVGPTPWNPGTMFPATTGNGD